MTRDPHSLHQTPIISDTETTGTCPSRWRPGFVYFGNFVTASVEIDRLEQFNGAEKSDTELWK
jgi:hypothetical protein